MGDRREGGALRDALGCALVLCAAACSSGKLDTITWPSWTGGRLGGALVCGSARDDVWGTLPNTSSQPGKTEVWHWDGATWTKVYAYPFGQRGTMVSAGHGAAWLYLSTPSGLLKLGPTGVLEDRGADLPANLAPAGGFQHGHGAGVFLGVHVYDSTQSTTTDTLLRFDGARFVVAPAPPPGVNLDVDARAVIGADEAYLFGGSGGTIAHLRGDRWSEVPVAVTRESGGIEWDAVWSSTSDVWFKGGYSDAGAHGDGSTFAAFRLVEPPADPSGVSRYRLFQPIAREPGRLKVYATWAHNDFGGQYGDARSLVYSDDGKLIGEETLASFATCSQSNCVDGRLPALQLDDGTLYIGVKQTESEQTFSVGKP